jgi:hypothetical protein
LLKKTPKFKASFSLLGDSWEVPDAVYEELKEFTCKMSGGQRFKNVDNLRLCICYIKKVGLMENNLEV